MNIENPILSIVVPCYNEADGIALTIEKLQAVLAELTGSAIVDENSFIFLVDDGSQDNTWELIKAYHENNEKVRGIRLSRNFGHQQALLAGLHAVSEHVDCAISIDADLQQDEKVIPEFINKFKNGADIVFGIREDRDTDSLLKKMTALAFYKIMERLGTPLVRNHADYRLTSKKSLEVLKRYGESTVFLRGIFADMGLPSDLVMFSVKERTAGVSKYTLKKMIAFAVHGISSFSVAPLRIISFMGFIIFSLSALMGFYILFRSLIIGDTVPGWASTTLPIYFLGGLQMLCLGVAGEYIGNIYIEAKSRPKYIISERLDG